MMIPDEVVMNKIYYIRGSTVMLGSDLAALYKMETKRLKKAVKRNISRFPVDFMFELTQMETETLRSQFATSSSKHGGIRYLPMVFTEHALADATELRLEIEKIKKKLDNNDKHMELVFQYIDELSEKKQAEVPIEKIGFKVGPKRK